MRFKTRLKSIFTFILSIVVSAELTAQPTELSTPMPPDDEHILAMTLNPDSPYYYPQLMMRYRDGDTTLTETDYYYLYYGYALTDDYQPLLPIPEEQQVLEAFQHAYADPSAENTSELMRHAENVMQKDPFSLSNINFMIFASGISGDTINERINYDRLTKLAAAISRSGTGTTESSPIYILRFSHANDLLGTMGLDIVKRLVVSRTTEYVSVADPDGHRSNKGYYFDYSRIYSGHDDVPADAARKKWKINDYQLGTARK